MHPANVFIDNDDKPGNIPSCETIILDAFKLAPSQQTDINIRGVRIPLEQNSDKDVSSIWVKFGQRITSGEARTQNFISKYLELTNNPLVRAPRVYIAFTWHTQHPILGRVRYCFIVGEYIDGQMCDVPDMDRIISVIQSLITIPSPNPTAPGPVGGGQIEHPVFVDRLSTIGYESVEELEKHMNRVLKITRRPGHVNLKEEWANHGLLLCVGDPEFRNFMKDKGDKIIAVDFGAYSFLPQSFSAHVLTYGFPPTNFKLRIAEVLNYPPSIMESALALEMVYGGLMQFGTNDIGLPSTAKLRLAKYQRK